MDDEETVDKIINWEMEVNEYLHKRDIEPITLVYGINKIFAKTYLSSSETPTKLVLKKVWIDKKIKFNKPYVQLWLE